MKVKVLYEAIKEIEVEIDEKFAECVRLTDVPWSDFPKDRIDEWYDDCEKIHQEVAKILPQIDNDFDNIITITTKNDNAIYN